MTTIDVETTEPSDLPAPPGPLNQAITADQTVGPTALADFVRQAMAELPAIAGADRATAHRYFDDFALRRLPAALATARQDTVTAAMAPLAEMFADAGGMVQLSREQARGRASDFEIIEYILRGQPGGVPGTWGHHFDDYLLHAPITDQHRNKIAHQAALIESALGSDPADVPSTAPARATGRRILLIASGGAADLRRVDPALLHPADRLVLNDVDPDALQYALTHLPPATRAQTAAAPGNVLRTAAHLAADHGPLRPGPGRRPLRLPRRTLRPSPDPHHPVPPVPPRRHVLLLQHRDPEPLRRPDDPHRPLEPRRTHPRRHRGRRPCRRAAGNRRRTGHHRRCHWPDAVRDGAAR